MKTKIPLLLATLVTSFMVPSSGPAQNAVVTYQGRVTDNGTNFSGMGQFKFALVTSTNNNHTATAIAPVQSGAVLRVLVVDGGNGYITPPTVTIAGGGGLGATATASISGGAVASIQLDTAGSNYVSPPTVTISPPPETSPSSPIGAMTARAARAVNRPLALAQASLVDCSPCRWAMSRCGT